MFLRAKSSKEIKHSHIVNLFSIEDGQMAGETTTADGHNHPVIVETQAIMAAPPMIQQQAQETKTVVSLGEVNGHTHELEPIETKTEDRFKTAKTKEEKAARVEECHQMRKKALSNDASSREKAKLAEKYYENDQWKKPDALHMDTTKQPALTANVIHSTMLKLFGHQRNNRTSLKFYPVESGDQLVSDILEIVSKVIFQQNNFYQEESEVFERGCIGGLDNFNIYIDYNDDVKGTLVIEELHRDKVLFGPHLKKDLKDCEYLVKETMFSYEKLAKLYPKLAKELKTISDRIDITNLNEEIKGTSGVEADAKTGGRLYSNIYSAGEMADVFDKLTKSVKQCELWEKVYFTDHVFVNTETMADPEKLINWEDDDIEALKTLKGAKIVTVVSTFIRITKFACDVMLDDEYPDLAIQDFHVIPFYAEKRVNGFCGKVEYNQSIQDAINKFLSKMADILNKVNGRGFYYDEDTFETSEDAIDFKENQHLPNFLQKVRDVAKTPKREDGVQYPAELERGITMLLQLFDRLMNVNTDFLGIKTSAESAIAQEGRKQEAILGNEYLFDNFKLSKKKVGKILVPNIQRVYPPDRIIRILENQNQRSPFKLANKPYTEYDPAELKRILDEADLTKYDVFIETAADSPSILFRIFLILSDLAGKGLNIPEEIIIELVPDIPESMKARILDEIKKRKEQQMQIESGKMQSENAKTETAANAKIQTEMIKQEAKQAQIQAGHRQ